MFSMVVLFTLLVACDGPREPVNIAGNQWLGYQPLYIAHAQGCQDCPFARRYYGGQPLQLNIMPSTTTVTRLLSNGQLDGALVTLDEAISLQSSSDIDVCVARVLSFSDGADAVMISPTANLANTPLRIGYEETALGGFLLHRAMQFLELTPSDVRTYMLVPTDHVAGLFNGSIDMVVTYEPFISQLLSQGAQVVFDSTQIPHEIVDVFIMRTDVWRKNKEMLDWVARDLWESGRYALLNPELAKDEFLPANVGLNSAELTNALTGLYFPNYEENRQVLSRELPAILANLNEYMLSAGLIDDYAVLPSCYEL